MPTMERLAEHPSLEELHQRFDDLTPQLVKCFKPTDAAAQKEAFLAGEVITPRHEYAALTEIDYAAQQQQLAILSQQIRESPHIADKFRAVYLEKVTGYIEGFRMMQIGAELQGLEGEERLALEEEFFALGSDGGRLADEATYAALVYEARERFSSLQLEGHAAEIRDELFALFPAGSEAPRFTPSAQTVAWAHTMGEALFAPMVAHVPEQDEKFSPAEIRDIFEEIIVQEFGEAASDWQVLLEEAQAIYVSTSRRAIVIPADRQPADGETLKDLVVHELGAHLLRAVAGGESDFDLLRTGMPDYLDAEEGLGVVFEQARKGEFADRGVPAYLGIAAAQLEGKDFRQCFEMLWRYYALDAMEPATLEVTEKQVKKARSMAYSRTMRVFRGTDTVPWGKDLSYYNGNMKIWQHLEETRGDDMHMQLLLLGKADSTNPAHRYALLESRSL